LKYEEINKKKLLGVVKDRPCIQMYKYNVNKRIISYLWTLKYYLAKTFLNGLAFFKIKTAKLCMINTQQGLAK